MEIMILLLSLLFLAYAVLLLYYRAGWIQMPEYKLNRQHEPKTRVTILIPARNEEKYIGKLLEEVCNQLYPPNLMEIIVIDDHSNDATAQIAQQYKRVRCLSLSDFIDGETLNAYKKKAIEVGIQQSSGELILTLDADCRLCNYWLLSIISYYEKYRHAFIASPVLYHDSRNWFQSFQSIDFTTMQGITAALAQTHSGTMCNGANLAYTRRAFEAVNGFEGIDQLASGDDMLLMYKLESKFPQRTTWLKCKDAIVYTYPVNTLTDFLQQRVRWASKANHFDDKRMQAVLLFVFVFNASFLFLLIGSFFDARCLAILVTMLLGKIGIELSFLIPVASFFRKKKELFRFPWLQGLHILYILYAGLRGQAGMYQWKDRKVS